MFVKWGADMSTISKVITKIAQKTNQQLINVLITLLLLLDNIRLALTTHPVAKVTAGRSVGRSFSLGIAVDKFESFGAELARE